MDCAQCEQLLDTLTKATTRYAIAKASAFFVVCADVAAYRRVEFERAKNDFEDHRLTCKTNLMVSKQASKQPAAVKERVFSMAA